MGSDPVAARRDVAWASLPYGGPVRPKSEERYRKSLAGGGQNAGPVFVSRHDAALRARPSACECGWMCRRPAEIADRISCGCAITGSPGR